MKFKNISLPTLGLLQASALVAYVWAVTSLMDYIGDNIPDEDTVLGSMTALLLFVLSAVVSAGIVLGRAGQLYMAKKLKEAYRLVGWTVVWCLVYFAGFALFLLSN